MDNEHGYASDVAFTPTVKAVQNRKGARRAYARMEQAGSWPTTITPDLAAFIAAQRSVFLATASPDNSPGRTGIAQAIGFVYYSSGEAESKVPERHARQS